MVKLNSGLMAGVALSALLLAGCGGNGEGGGGGGFGGSAPPMEQTVSNVFDYITQLIANNDANSEPIDINPLTLAVDDTAEPTPLN